MKLSIIIPLFNEEALIIQVVDKVLSVSFPDCVEYWEIIIVDDCSTDGSYMKVKSYVENNSKVKIYKHDKNKGKGASVKTGIKHACGDVYLIQDADLELSPSDIPKLIVAMNDLKMQFINGSRYMGGIVRPLYSFRRYSANKLFTFLTSILINVKLTDMACGYKLIAKDLYDKISLRENRFGFEAELIIKAMRVKRNNVAEVPVQYFPRNEGEGKKFMMGDGIKVLWTIIRYGLFRFR